MVVSIDENILLGFLGVIFVPLIAFIVKLVIDIGVIKSDLKAVTTLASEHDMHERIINKHENRLNLVESRVDRAERDLSRSSSRNNNNNNNNSPLSRGGGDQS